MLPRSIVSVVALTVVATLASGCASSSERRGARQGTSRLGMPLYPPPLAPEVRVAREDLLADAQTSFDADPTDEAAIVWYGRRTAYLGEYRRAIAIFGDGLDVLPGSYKLRRHRGHRYLTVRRVDDAIADLDAAAQLIEGVPDEVEPDGLPNRLNRPTSTSHTNIYYHLGLAHYVSGDFARALDAYWRCLYFSRNDDMRCATSYWLYLTLRRLGQDDAAMEVLTPIDASMNVIENTTYHRLLLLFKGELAPEDMAPDAEAVVGADIDDATLAYGVAMWHHLHGDPARAQTEFRRIVDGPGWPAFGYLAAEAELARVVK